MIGNVVTFPLTAPVTKNNRFPGFVIASLIGRGARFYLVAGLIAANGERMEGLLQQYVERIGWAVVAIVVLIGVGVTLWG